ncbi:MAG: ClbS/DfsB family four-helix bundle protein [Rhodobacteraceae bacterium]|nr:ClbS/DfsB family four-helix bundle protein [Paracoccaceae bacterium]
MPAATHKSALVAVTEKEFAKLLEVLGQVPESLALVKDEDDTSIKDVVAHRAHWIDLFLGWWSDGQAGVDVAFPAPGYKWSDLKAYNAALRARQTGIGWHEAQAELQGAHERLMFFLAKHGNAELYGGPMKGARNDWTTGRWAEAAGASHYRSASKYLRSRLRVPTE